MSTDTMYINSSRVLPSRSKNKQPNAMFPRSNSGKGVANNSASSNNSSKNNSNNNKANNRKRGTRRGDGGGQNQRSSQRDASIPQPQVLPNGDKPNFGNSTSTADKRRGSSNKKDARNVNHAKNVTADLKNLLLDSANKNMSPKRASDKSPRAGSNTHANKKQEVINVNTMKKESTTPIMTFLTSPINAPGSIPSMNLSESANAVPQTQRAPGSTGVPPGPAAPNILAGPGLNMPPQFVGRPLPQQPQQPMIAGNILPMAQPGFQPRYMQQMGPQPAYGMPIGQQLPPPNMLPGQHMQGLGYPFGVQNNYNLSSMPVQLPQQIPLMAPMGHNQNMRPANVKSQVPPNAMAQGPAPPMTKTNQNTPVSTPTSLLSNQVSPKAQNNKSKSSAKKNKDRNSSHSFAGASFATDVPQESNLPKPSFL